jgi:hypothetical protein
VSLDFRLLCDLLEPSLTIDSVLLAFSFRVLLMLGLKVRFYGFLKLPHSTKLTLSAWPDRLC